MNEATPQSRPDRIREAYRRAVGDHDYSERDVEDYYAIKHFLPAIRAAVPDVTLQEVCAVRWEDERLSHCPAEIESFQAPCCLLAPTGYPTGPDIIGPFDSYEEAKAFAETYPETYRESDFRTMISPAAGIMHEMGFSIGRARFASKLGVPIDVLKPRPPAPQNVVVEVNPTVARDVAQYLERNCPLPGVREICALLKIAATKDCVVGPQNNLPPELKRAR